MKKLEKLKPTKIYEPKVKILSTKFADMQPGQKMAIGTPEIIAKIIKIIPRGSERSLNDIRKELAKTLKAHVACPVTTSMFLKVAIENEVAKGKARFTFPFWRVVSPKSKIFKRLQPVAKKAILSRRLQEGLS